MNEWCNESYNKSDKEHLNAMTRNNLFNKETLYTYLTEIESIMDGQPLTTLGYDINDFEVLMPSHCLTGTANPNLLICPVEKLGDITN